MVDSKRSRIETFNDRGYGPASRSRESRPPRVSRLRALGVPPEYRLADAMS